MFLLAYFNPLSATPLNNPNAAQFPSQLPSQPAPPQPAQEATLPPMQKPFTFQPQHLSQDVSLQQPTSPSITPSSKTVQDLFSGSVTQPDAMSYHAQSAHSENRLGSINQDLSANCEHYEFMKDGQCLNPNLKIFINGDTTPLPLHPYDWVMQQTVGNNLLINTSEREETRKDQYTFIQAIQAMIGQDQAIKSIIISETGDPFKDARQLISGGPDPSESFSILDHEHVFLGVDALNKVKDDLYSIVGTISQKNRQGQNNFSIDIEAYTAQLPRKLDLYESVGLKAMAPGPERDRMLIQKICDELSLLTATGDHIKDVRSRGISVSKEDKENIDRSILFIGLINYIALQLPNQELRNNISSLLRISNALEQAKEIRMSPVYLRPGEDARLANMFFEEACRLAKLKNTQGNFQIVGSSYETQSYVLKSIADMKGMYQALHILESNDINTAIAKLEQTLFPGKNKDQILEYMDKLNRAYQGQLCELEALKQNLSQKHDMNDGAVRATVRLINALQTMLDKDRLNQVLSQSNEAIALVPSKQEVQPLSLDCGIGTPWNIQLETTTYTVHKIKTYTDTDGNKVRYSVQGGEIANQMCLDLNRSADTRSPNGEMIFNIPSGHSVGFPDIGSSIGPGVTLTENAITGGDKVNLRSANCDSLLPNETMLFQHYLAAKYKEYFQNNVAERAKLANLQEPEFTQQYWGLCRKYCESTTISLADFRQWKYDKIQEFEKKFELYPQSQHPQMYFQDAALINAMSMAKQPYAALKIDSPVIGNVIDVVSNGYIGGMVAGNFQAYQFHQSKRAGLVDVGPLNLEKSCHMFLPDAFQSQTLTQGSTKIFDFSGVTMKDFCVVNCSSPESIGRLLGPKIPFSKEREESAFAEFCYDRHREVQAQTQQPIDWNTFYTQMLTSAEQNNPQVLSDYRSYVWKWESAAKAYANDQEYKDFFSKINKAFAYCEPLTPNIISLPDRISPDLNVTYSQRQFGISETSKMSIAEQNAISIAIKPVVEVSEGRSFQ